MEHQHANDLGGHPRVVGRLVDLISVWELHLGLLGHMVMSQQVSSKGVNFEIVDGKSGGLYCTWVKEGALVHHHCLKRVSAT